MALRAFQSNPSIGGFGGESLFSRRRPPGAPARSLAPSQSRNGAEGAAGRRGAGAASGTAAPAEPPRGGTGCGDAFAQIVKELVDNAVDACAPPCERQRGAGESEARATKRVRVTMTSVEVPKRPAAPNKANANANANDHADISAETMMECLRIEVSDNGCGMEDIDDCVTAFRSNKIGAAATKGDARAPRKASQPAATKGDARAPGKASQPAAAAAKRSGTVALPAAGTAAPCPALGEGGTHCSSPGVRQCRSRPEGEEATSPPAPGDEEGHTSGRYGVGLTLCLLHAQRLCPGTGASITSATRRQRAWTRAVYEPDAGADDIVCKRKERFPKVGSAGAESGTTVSVLVPGGEDARAAWPRLAEYFARFQLSIDLSCSLEVKAPTLQSTPLYIRPPAEIERRSQRRRKAAVAPHSSSERKDRDNGNIHERLHGGGWKGDDGFDDDASPEARGAKSPREPRTSKAAQRRAEAARQQEKKIALIRKAAAAYKSRPGLAVESVAYSSQPIRRGAGAGRSAGKNEDGPVLEIGFAVYGAEPDDDDGDDGDGDDDDDSRPRRDRGHRRHGHCKGSATLQVVRMVNGIPLLDSSEALACGVVRKVASSAATWNSFGLTVAQHGERRAGDPAAAPEGRDAALFALNDSAQVAPFLQSSAHSLFREQNGEGYGSSSSSGDDVETENRTGKRKKEREASRCILPAQQRLGDVLMVVQIRAKPSALPLPSLSKGRLPLNDKGISDALDNGISDCLRCLQRSSPGLLLTAQQLKRVDRDVKYVPSVAGAMASVLCRSQHVALGNVMKIASGWEGKTAPRRERPRSTVGERSEHPHVDSERSRVEALCPLLERRLRLAISDEFKDAKKAEEREKLRRERREIAASKKRDSKSNAIEWDGFESDCDGSSKRSSVVESARARSRTLSSSDDFDSDVSSPLGHAKRRRRRNNSASSSEQSILRRNGNCQKKPHCGDFDSDASVDSKHSSDGRSRVPLQKSSNSDMTSPSVHGRRQQLKQNQAGGRNSSMAHTDEFADGYESSPGLSHRRRGGKRSDPMAQSSEKFRHEHSPKLGFQSDESGRSNRSLSQAARKCDDTMSSDSEWSSQYGDVVPGHLLR